MSNSRKRLVVWVLGLSVVAATAACDSSVSPSALPGSTSGLSGSTISGQINAGSSASTLAATASGTGAGMTVTSESAGKSTTADSAGRFTLTGLSEGRHQLRFSGAGSDARLGVSVGKDERVDIAVRVNGNNATIESERRAPSENRGPNDNRVELEGLVTELSVPTRTLKVQGMVVTLPAEVVIRHGSSAVALTALKVGDRVHVKGTRQTGGGVLASEVKVQNANGDDDEDDDDDENEFKGVVSGLTGTCPAITFKINSMTIVTNAATKFEDGPCTAIANGKSVEVEGNLGSNGSIVAAKVELYY